MMTEKIEPQIIPYPVTREFLAEEVFHVGTKKIKEWLADIDIYHQKTLKPCEYLAFFNSTYVPPGWQLPFGMQLKIAV